MKVLILILATVSALAQNAPLGDASTTVSYASVTGNNTSACTTDASHPHCSANFTGLVDPLHPSAQTPITVPAPTNTSTLDIHQLAPDGVLVLFHVMPWWKSGTGDHTQMKYVSNDTNTAHAQVTAMLDVFHGDGAIVDWYGDKDTAKDGATKKLRDELLSRGSGPQKGPYLALMVDKGAIIAKNYACADTNHQCITDAWKSILCYANGNYFGSDTYLKLDSSTKLPSSSGKIVVFTFPPGTNSDGSTGWNSADMTAVRAYGQTLSATCPAGQNANNGQIWLINQDSSGWNSPYDGAFNWVGSVSWDPLKDCRSSTPFVTQLGSEHCWQKDNGTYHSSFYSTGNSNSSKLTVGSAKAGFNDNNASWSKNRVIARECANTWLRTWATASASSTVKIIQVDTFNDAEEGSAIESGIDNCYSLASPSVDKGIFSWSLVAGNSAASTATIDHMQVYLSKDGGANLGPVGGNLTAAVSQLNLATLGLSPGTYSAYIQMVGQPVVQNRFATAVGTFVQASARPGFRGN